MGSMMSDNAEFVFIVIDSRFGVVAASLVCDEAVAEMNARTLSEAASDTLSNPGSFRVKRVKLGRSQKFAPAPDPVP